ncbi:MAG: putative extracellular undecaheme cytochrome c, partial [Deltaproteobacteria bacterium]|nr:putative extracellular undecaheme cytochrome c [Deltaproteobacteria bacterium]
GQGFPSCQTCHGANFAGGSTGVSCFLCHAPPHGRKPWRASAGSTYTHTTTAEAGNAPVCYQCHAYTGTANPLNPHVPPSPAPAGTAPGCFNGTMCHNEAGHAVPFNTTVHYSVTSGTFAANCGTCHAVTGTSPVSGAPLCTTCHAAGSPLTALNCTSCHASPPNGGAGAAYPNIEGAHAEHIALTSTGTPISCNTCHNGLGTNTLNHYNSAKSRVSPGDAAFLATYSAKTGASTFLSGALTCANVSCHGGTSPNWQTGAINVNTACTICHSEGTTQYNSYNSGAHQKHVGGEGLSCTVCHNTTTLAVNHFTNLSTTAMEGPASATIGGTGTTVTSYSAGSCTPQGGVGCHGTRSW